MAAVTPSSFLLDHIDDASANLILQLQLDDLKDLKLKRSGKQREDSQNDGEVAAELLEENIDNLLTFLGDRRMTRSIAQAVQADGVILARTALEEEVSHEDHALAQRLNGSTVNWEANVRSESIDDAVLSKLAGLYVSEELGQKLATGDLQLDEEEADEHPETSAWAASRQNAHKPNAVNHHCEACQEQKKYFDVVAAPCGHEYCRDCLRDLFSASFTDESLFPPRCCRQSISLKTVSIFLTSRLKEEYERKKIEFSTPNRTYCSRPLCSSFIPAENINDEIASCPSCAARTCAICKAESHAGQDCPNDTALLETLNLAQENGWQRCYSCRRLVELDIGCNHMTFVSYHPLLKLLLTLEGALVPGQIKSSNETHRNFQQIIQFELSECKRRHRCFEIGTTAHMAVGDMSVAHTSVKSATFTFQSTSLSVDNAEFWLATDAEEIDCSQDMRGRLNGDYQNIKFSPG